MEPLHAIFDSYKLDDLDREWIEQVYESGFSNVDNVPIDYLVFLESPDTTDLLRNTCSIVKNWIAKNRDVRVNDREEVSWETLVALNLDVRALLSVIAYLIRKGQTFDARQDSRLSSLQATGLYFVLLTIPGSNAFQAFQPNLYETALKSLELSGRLNNKEKRSKRKNSHDTENSSDEEDDTELRLGCSQRDSLMRELNAVMYDLVTMLKSARTAMEVRSLETTIYYLVEATKLADEPINLRRSNEATLNSLAHNAYVALEQICSPKYASIGAVARLIAKYTLPQFLVSGVNLPARQSATVRESTMYFYKNLLLAHGEEIRAALAILIQHTMIKCPERSEGRHKQTAIIIKLLNLCCGDRATLKRCINDLLRLSHHSKISCRIFGQEIVGKFVMELSKYRHDGETYRIFSECKIEEILLASALGRCVDVSSMVRGRAIATFAEFTDSIDRPEVRKLFHTWRGDAAARELPSLEKLEEALESGDVDFLVPDTDEIMAALKDRLEDERALVRRSALQVLRNGVMISPELLDLAIPIVRRHCRDSVLTVRRYAIRVLTNLLETFTDKSELCDDWVDSVIPRIFDSEPKVQEEVLDSLGKLTIDKITNHSPENDSTVNDLPWRILAGIANNKMGEHLARACATWHENGRINETKVTAVKSHIGTSNNMGAWLLLASISENTRLSRMETYYTIYGRSLVASASSDVFLTSLVLRVLKNSWPTFDLLTLRHVARDLTDHLKNYRVKVALIRHCLDILLDVSKHLERLDKSATPSDNDTGSLEITRDLVTLSETTIIRVVKSDGNEEDPDDMLFRAVCTLGHASFLSWIQISINVRRILQRFLLEWNGLPDCVRDKKELQGAAVMVLGQQALIDRDIAVEMTPIFGCLLCNNGTSRRGGGGDGDFNDCGDGNTASGPVVRINAAKALADVCVRFTALVEPYLPDMCVSMKDPNPEVRQVILVIFIQLLVEDTIMVKEAFFFHILTMLADDDPTIREMTIFLVKERLLVKNKNLITQRFLNGIYHFNDYERCTSLVDRRRQRRRNTDAGVLSLAGRENTKKRRIIYDFMLENVDHVGKMALLVKLTGHIVNPRSNGSPDVGCEKGVSVIRDALYVVSSDHLQANSCSRHVVEDENVEETGNTTNNSLLVEAMKKHRNYILLPCLVELKEHCEKLKSSLVEDVTKILVQSVADCAKEALTSLYNEYPKLEREIQRDSRKYSKRARDESVEEEDNDDERSYCETPKKSSLERHSALINPDRMPRIVLRRLSALTYPGISGCGEKANETKTGDTETAEISAESTRESLAEIGDGSEYTINREFLLTTE